MYLVGMVQIIVLQTAEEQMWSNNAKTNNANRNRHVKICSKSVLFVHVFLYKQKQLSTEAGGGKKITSELC